MVATRSMTGRLLVAGLACLLALPACSAPYDYRNIKPRHEVRNSPVPVPWPRVKPAPPPIIKASPKSKPVTRVAQPQAKPVTRVAEPQAKPRTKAQSRPKPKAVQTALAMVTVRRGDTLYGIARRHGASVRDVIDANGLTAPYGIQAGQRLKVPYPRIHVVAKGDTSYSISRRYGVDLASLTRVNGLKSPYTLSIGQELKLPGGARAVPLATGLTTATARGPIPAPPPRAGSSFAWPVVGPIISRFGPKGGGLHNDGINIRAPKGTAVRAAEAGVVAYAGSELRAYGNLLLIRHAGGWVTAYAHNERLLVSRGERVNRGQVIARVGASGGVSEPQLHFEVRKGTQAVNPQRYLERRQASR